MAKPRVLIEAQFSIEARSLLPRAGELSAQASYLLVFFLTSGRSEFPAHTCLLINPGETIQLAKSNRPSDVLLVQIAPPLLIEGATRLKLFRTGSMLLFRHVRTQEPKLAAALAAIHHEMSEAAAGWREVIQSLLQQLTVYLLRSHINLKRSEELELSRVGIVDRRLRRAIEFMHDNCARVVGLAEIAAAAYLSEFHFARLFKKITSTTPHAYLSGLRIERARKLLVETELAITEVGARVGYNSQSHFTKIFREATGLTPKAFRAAGASPAKQPARTGQ